MTKRQADQFDMILVTENHFDDNPTATTGYAAIIATKTLLSLKIDALQLERNKQLLVTTGSAVDKANARHALESTALNISGVISGHSTTIGNSLLYDRVHISPSDLGRMKDNEFLGFCLNLHNQTLPYGASLAPGVTPAILTSFLNSINAYSTLSPNPEELINVRKTATQNIGIMLPDILNNILERRLDNEIMAMNTANPDFVTTYFNCRAITDSPTSNMSLTITCLDHATSSPLANVDINIDNGALLRTSSARGYNTVINLPEGSHTLTATKPGYADVTMSFVTVAEETLELLVTLHTV